jgi:hypothetical protein
MASVSGFVVAESEMASSLENVTSVEASAKASGEQLLTTNAS